MTNINESVFFHEDNYCQIELLPIENLLIKSNETNLTQHYAESHLTEDGFTSIVSRAQIAYPLTNLNITFDVFQNILKEDALSHFNNVYTGYSSQRSPKKNVHGFGFENYILYYEFGNNLITKAWIDYNELSETLNIYPQKLQTALLKLGENFNLILIDWNELITVTLKKQTSVIDYIRDVL